MDDNKFLQRLSRNLLQVLDDNNENYDVTIEVGSDPDKTKKFRAHMVILSFRSSHLRSILKKNVGTSTHIKLPNILPETFQSILRYVYGGSLLLKEYDAPDIVKILIAANELDLQELVISLQTFLINSKANWMEQNFDFIYQISFENNSFLEFQDFCANYFSNNPDKILDFSSIPKKILVTIIQNSNYLSEVQVWEYVVKWGVAQNPELPSDLKNYSKDDFNTLKNTLQELIPFVEFRNLTCREFLDNVLPYKKILPKGQFMELSKDFLENDYIPILKHESQKFKKSRPESIYSTSTINSKVYSPKIINSKVFNPRVSNSKVKFNPRITVSDSNIFNSRIIDSKNIDKEIVDSKNIDDKEIVDSKNIDREIVNSKNIDPIMIDSKNIDREIMKNIDQEIVDSKNIDPEIIGSNIIDSKNTGSNIIDPRNPGSTITNSRSIDLNIINSKSIDSTIINFDFTIIDSINSTIDSKLTDSRFSENFSSKFIDSILIDSEIISNKHAELISRWIDKSDSNTNKPAFPYEFKLIFRGSRDGLSPKKFHKICDNKPNTVIFVKVEGSKEIFGGYNPIIWKSDRVSSATKNSFIFSFKDKENIKNHILSRVVNEKDAINNGVNYGPSFGNEDLHLYRSYLRSELSLYCNYHRKTSYERPIRDHPGYIGRVKELEVFQIMTSH